MIFIWTILSSHLLSPKYVEAWQKYSRSIDSAVDIQPFFGFWYDVVDLL
jgi:hypothetical protein